MSSFSTSMPVDAVIARIRSEVARRKLSGAQPSDQNGSPVFADAVTSLFLAQLPQPHLPKARFTPAERFHLNDFLALHDLDFVDAAYLGVLKRKVDRAGREHYLQSLRVGSLSKIEILGRLRYSPEGRRLHVPVKALLPAFAVQHACRIPVLGSVLSVIMALIRLPRTVRILQGLEGYQHQRNAELEAAIGNLALAADGNSRQLADEVSRQGGALEQEKYATVVRMQELEARLAHAAALSEQTWSDHQGRMAQADRASETTSVRLTELAELCAANARRSMDLDAQMTAASERQAILEQRLTQFGSHKQEIDRQLVDVIALAQQTSAQLASSLSDSLGTIEQRIEALGGAVESRQQVTQDIYRRLIERIARAEGRLHEQGMRILHHPASLQADPVALAVPNDESRFDRFYVAFEQHFRGSREDIRQRLTYYLPLLRDSVVGREHAPVLDIGCGRGEWLELLRAENMSASGIDLNAGMVEQCNERGLQVIYGDAIAHLKLLPDNTLGALTGFHIIEHIPLETLLELIEQAQRVVQPDGLVIFETPNPENIVVGSCNFYIDPTHQRPLPPIMTKFLVEAGGFVDVAIHRVNAGLLPQVFEESAESDPQALRTALQYLRSVFLCAPDYSVVGRVA